MTPVNGFAPLAQMQLFELSGRRVLVMGLGESGLAMAQWCGDRGARLRLADTRATRIESMPEPVRSWAEGQEHQWVGGAFTEAWLEGVDLVCWSPGLSTEQGDSAAFLQQARARSIPVFGELDLFVQALAHLAHNDYRPRVVAVTGTNGKTTTTALTARLLVASGLRAQAAGNIGPAMLSALAAALASGSLPEVWVLELSSFQLALCQGFDPHRFTHIQQKHVATLRQGGRLEHQLGRLWDGHEIANDLRVGKRDRPARSDLLMEQGHHRAGRAPGLIKS